jgi:Gpi18-like mannosyltransferase
LSVASYVFIVAMSANFFTSKPAIPARLWADIVVLVFLVGTALAPTMLLYAQPRNTTIRMDTPQALLPREGMYRFERWPGENAGVYSWTNGSSTLKLPNPGGETTIQIKLLGPTDAPRPAQMRFGQVPFSFLVSPAPRVYSIILPAMPRERITLTINSPRVNINRRELGIGISDIQIAGGGAAPVQVLLALALATIGCYTLLRQARLSWLVAAGIILATQALIQLWLAADGWSYARLGSLLPLIGSAALITAALDRWWPTIRARSDEGRKREDERPQDLLSSSVLRPSSTLGLTRRDLLVIATLLLAALGVRLLYLSVPDPVGDLELSARRMGLLYANGLAGAYTGDGDYLPLRLYWLWAISKLVPLLGGNFAAPLPAATLLLIKLPGLLADLATIAVIYGWSRRWQPLRVAALIAATYTLAAPVWINVAWWGQVDAVLMLALLGALILLERAEGRWSWLCWLLAMLIKTQAIVLAPLLFVSTLRLHGARGLVRAAGLTFGALALLQAPLILAGQLPGLLQSYDGSVGRFPRTTVAAYNLWFLVLGGGSARDTEFVFGTVSYRIAGMTLFGLVTALVCLALLRRADAPARAESAAVLALAFFTLPTQIHERYLFLALAFLVLRIASAPWVMLPYLIVTATATLNILGTLKGFAPAVYDYMSESTLALGLAVVNLLVLAVMLGHLLLVAWRAAEPAAHGFNPEARSGGGTEAYTLPP